MSETLLLAAQFEIADSHMRAAITALNSVKPGERISANMAIILEAVSHLQHAQADLLELLIHAARVKQEQ